MEELYRRSPNLERESYDGHTQVSLETNAFTNRNIFLFGDIDEKLFYHFMLQMMHLSVDETKPIQIYMSTQGGEVNAGLAMYDLIQMCKAPIYIYCVGTVASMGAVLLASAPKGNRYILPHGQVMIHEPLISNGLGGSASSINKTAMTILKVRDQINAILAKHTGKSIEEINQATDHDHYFNAKEAIEFGLCDHIINELKVEE